jgi:hypothetical protein
MLIGMTGSVPVSGECVWDGAARGTLAGRGLYDLEAGAGEVAGAPPTSYPPTVPLISASSSSEILFPDISS